MGLLENPSRSGRSRKFKRTARAIHKALESAYKEAGEYTVAPDDRLIIFSDLHKGARDGADDFQRCERSYNAALVYYRELGFTLIELGDVEELWENSVDEVLNQYPRTLELTSLFAAERRYVRFWGNHDLAWSNAELFKKRLASYGLGDVAPIEALRLSFELPDRATVPEFFLVHGHQGTSDSDRYRFWSWLFVHFAWRRIQRSINRPWNTPSMDWSLRGEHAEHMEAWAADTGRVLIAGHTHQPVFYGEAKAAQKASRAPNGLPTSQANALQHAWAEWAAAEVVRLELQPSAKLSSPCYFNTGCCAFGDGDITGIEISDHEIRLVRWPCNPETERQVLGRLSLDYVFSQAGGTTNTSGPA